MSSELERDVLTGPQEDQIRALEVAAAADNLAIVDRLLCHGVPFGKVFDMAAERRKWALIGVMLKYLEQRVGTVDCHDLTGEAIVVSKIRPVTSLVFNGLLTVALELAAKANKHAVVKDLLEAGAGVKVGKALFEAIGNDSHESAELIMRDPEGNSSVRKVNAWGNYPLHLCVLLGKPIMAKLLLDVGKADVNVKTGPMGHTALYRSIKKGRRDVVSVLLNHPDIDLDAVCGLFQDTALHAATQSFRWAMTALLKRGANPNVRSSDFATPLHEAVQRRTFAIPVAEELIQAGADPNAICFRGRSPLHVAAGVVKPEVVSFLLSPGGADETIKCFDGKTAAEIVGNLVRTSTVYEGDRLLTMEHLKRAPVERMWRRRLLPLLCRSRIKGSETRLPDIPPLSPDCRCFVAPSHGGAGSASSDNGTTIWLFRETPLELFRFIIGFL